MEEIRDGMLALDDSLDLKMGGTLQSGTGHQPENSSERLSVDPETQRLRTIYLPLRRANLPPLLNLFDFGDATTSSGERLQTNVAPQALFMLNSHFVEARSRKLAELLLKDPHSSDRERLNLAHLRTLSRHPQSEELDRALDYIRGFQERSPGDESRLPGLAELLQGPVVLQCVHLRGLSCACVPPDRGSPILDTIMNDLHSLYRKPQMPVSRRAMLRASAGGFGFLVLAGLLAGESGLLAEPSGNPLAGRTPHFKAQSQDGSSSSSCTEGLPESTFWTPRSA